MLEAFKRWISRGAGPVGWTAVAEWAKASGCMFKRTRDGLGFVVDCDEPGNTWRLEWGPSQRPYITGPELRLRADLRTGQGLNLLLITRPLMEALEKQVYEQTTEGNQTLMDDAMPEEMRWLVLYPRLPSAELKGLRDAFSVHGNLAPAVAGWVGGPLGVALTAARSAWLNPAQPLVMMVQRGRLTLRTGLPEPDVAAIEPWLGLFSVAAREARRHADHWAQAAGGSSTQPSLWGRASDGAEPPA